MIERNKYLNKLIDCPTCVNADSIENALSGDYTENVFYSSQNKRLYNDRRRNDPYVTGITSITRKEFIEQQDKIVSNINNCITKLSALEHDVNTEKKDIENKLNQIKQKEFSNYAELKAFINSDANKYDDKQTYTEYLNLLVKKISVIQKCLQVKLNDLNKVREIEASIDKYLSSNEEEE